MFIEFKSIQLLLFWRIEYNRIIKLNFYVFKTSMNIQYTYTLYANYGAQFVHVLITWLT